MVTCGIIGMILPKTSLEKMFRMAVSVFFLTTLLAPFALEAPAITFDLQSYSFEDIQRRADRLEEATDIATLEVFRADLEKIVEQKLDEMGIIYTQLAIHITTDGQNNQPDAVVDLRLDSRHQHDHQRIRRQISGELGLDVRIGYG